MYQIFDYYWSISRSAYVKIVQRVILVYFVCFYLLSCKTQSPPRQVLPSIRTANKWKVPSVARIAEAPHEENIAPDVVRYPPFGLAAPRLRCEQYGPDHQGSQRQLVAVVRVVVVQTPLRLQSESVVQLEEVAAIITALQTMAWSNGI